ncbi:hypothetical protein Pa4123_38990 [Phytohabitans aurantiacus]|uniref:Integral membrane protein n=1 Tax=Phytohabitans aurantiacus TaxID=3016789 RepID=A0ABQ5QY44_9ACTN|nr:hypothetical protein Pa4123_38990 [Phytohabitans aurantiacus]
MAASQDQIAGDEQLTPEERGRLWAHGLHLGTMLFQRANIFLVAESLLLVSYTSMLAALPTFRSDRPAVTDRVIAGFGLLLTLAWMYVGHRHLQYYRLVFVRIREHLPEYRALRMQWRKRGASSLPILTYALPSLAGVLWVLLLVLTWR